MSRKSAFFIVINIVILCCCTFSVFAQDDPFEIILEELNISYEDLGYRPAGYWTRYPDPAEIPHILPAFNDLMSEPQNIYNFVNIMAVAVEDYLSPKYMEKKNDALLNIVYYTGTRNATVDFRSYSASLFAEIDEQEPIVNAVKYLYQSYGRVWKYNVMGNAADFPLIEENVRKQAQGIDPSLRPHIARTIIHLVNAYESVMVGRRNLKMEDVMRVWRIRQLGETQFDGLEYYPELEDCAKNIDMNSIYYAGHKLAQTSEMLVDSLDFLLAKEAFDKDNQTFDIQTPMGRIVISGKNKKYHEYSDAFFVLDLAGNDKWHGSVGATPSIDIPVSLVIDYDGNDRYENEEEYLPSQGAAILGAAMLLDVKGDDFYDSKRLSQGSAMLGMGILADLEGNDSYDMLTSGQGAAYFGVGVAIDVSGDDYYVIGGDGQGYGGVGGVGALVNKTGKDSYYARRPADEIVYRPDYHANEDKLNYSYVQGCGIGRRGDLSDGHAWAGGMGTIIDLEGDDFYESANWSLGCGYWYGMGFAYDGAGNDEYRATAWSMGAGAHYAIGALIDEGGNDSHTLIPGNDYGIAFGHDYVIALLLNRGGDDTYSTTGDGIGYSINLSQSFLIDTEGNDTYTTGSRRNLGWNNFDSQNPPVVGANFHIYSTQISVFADLGGEDKYLFNENGKDKAVKSDKFVDGFKRFIPEQSARDTLAHKEYYGIGWDTELKGEIKIFKDKLKHKYPEDN